MIVKSAFLRTAMTIFSMQDLRQATTFFPTPELLKIARLRKLKRFLPKGYFSVCSAII